MTTRRMSVLHRHHRGSLAPSTRKLAHEQLECRVVLAQTTGLFFNDPTASDGFTLFSPNTSTTSYLIDRGGNVVHQWPTSYVPGLVGYLLPDGSLIRDGSPHGQGGNGSINAAGAGGLLQRFNWDGQLIWQFSYDTASHLAHHDFQVMPNGNVLLIAWEKKTEPEATAAGRDPNLPGAGYLYPDSIVEVQPDLVNGGGTVVWEWHVWDHLVQQFDSTKANWKGPAGVADHPELIDLNYVSTFDEGGGQAEDWTHANGIDYNPHTDQIVLSVREFSEFWIIDHSTTTAQAAGHTGGASGRGGDLLYRWGNPQTYDAGTAADRQFYYQHDARWIPNGFPGAGHLMVFDNGFGRPGQDFSQVVEITPPIDGSGHYALTPGQAYGPVVPTWAYAAPLANFSAIISGAQRLANGNTRITYGPAGTFTEVTPQGQEVWKYVNPYTGGGTLGPETPIPSLGLSGAGLDTLKTNFVFQAADYPLNYAPQLASTVASRKLFYKGSPRWNVTTAELPGQANDNAIATDKTAYLPTGLPATFASVSSYTRGINGVMIDLTGTHRHLSRADFSFRNGNNNSPSTWATATLPYSFSVRPGAGVGGADRIEFTWFDNTITNTWLEVMVRANGNTGLMQNSDLPQGYGDAFFFGSARGDSGVGDSAGFITNANDELAARNHPASLAAQIPIANLYDYNRDGKVDANDALFARNHSNAAATALRIIVIGSAALVPEVSDESANVAAALGIAAVRREDHTPSAPLDTFHRVPLLARPAVPNLTHDVATPKSVKQLPKLAADGAADEAYPCAIDEELLALVAGHRRR